MKLIIVVATSRDGFITCGDDPNPNNWTSPEDKKFYADIRKKYMLVVQGVNTYEVNKTAPNDEKLKVVLTRSPEKYADVQINGVLEFVNLTPQGFVKKYEDVYNSCLVLGGSYVYTSFLKAGLIDEMFVTVEPLDNKSGVPFIGENKTLESIVSLPEPEVIKLNDSGTILKHYVLKK